MKLLFITILLVTSLLSFSQDLNDCQKTVLRMIEADSTINVPLEYFKKFNCYNMLNEYNTIKYKTEKVKANKKGLIILIGIIIICRIIFIRI